MRRFLRAGLTLLNLAGAIALSGAAASAWSAADGSLMDVKYWNSTQGRRDYEYQLLHLALEKTADDYPPYRLSRYTGNLGALRGRRALAEGGPINVYAAPPREKQGELEARIASIPILIMGGLLGYRQLITRQQMLPEMARITTAEELKKYTVGQGQGWPDVTIFRQNGYPVNDMGRYVNLFGMLDQGRFDYVSLGFVEASRELAKRQPESGSLVLVPGLFIHYPLPIIFHVAKKYEGLPERIEEGLMRALNDGSMARLFRTRFARELAAIQQNDVRVIKLKHTLPNLDWVSPSRYPPDMRWLQTPQWQ